MSFRATAAKASRRSKPESSRTKALLLNAAETLMREQGYAAVTSRRVAELAGSNQGLVHYYFGTMDDLFVALFERLANDLFLRQEQIVESDNPLRVFWNISADSSRVSLWNEFMALANHRPAVRKEVAQFGERWRQNQIEILEKVMRSRDVRTISMSIEGLAVFLESIARNIGIERNIGISAGHDAALASIFQTLDLLDPQDDDNDVARLAAGDDDD